MSHLLLRLRAALSRLRWILVFTCVWFGVAIIVHRGLGGMGWLDAVLCSFYLKIPPGIFNQGYAFWGQSVIFGIIVGLILRESLENYSERCRLMSGFMKNHSIIIGYSHLGARLVEHCIKKKLPYVLIEKNKDTVDGLLRLSEPVIVDDARTKDALPAANIAGAKRLIIASDNMETALIVTKNARDANASCHITARCPIDDLVGVLEKLGANHVFSTSRAAFKDLCDIMVD